MGREAAAGTDSPLARAKGKGGPGNLPEPALAMALAGRENQKRQPKETVYSSSVFS